jgi:REP element-mobilizing transposase RayT
VSFAVVYWLDALSRKEYKETLLKNLTYCQQNKGMEIIAWCIMSNHMHLVFRTVGTFKPEIVLGHFKSVSSREIVKAITENPKESRRNLLMQQFKKAGNKSSNVTNYQFWRHDNKPIELWSNKVIAQKVNYVHQNPVKAGLVYRAEDYIYSSAVDYAGEKGLLDDIVLADLRC